MDHPTVIFPRLRYLVCEDLHDLSISSFDAQSTSTTPALIRLNQVDGVLIRGFRPRKMAGTLLRLEGNKSANVSLIGNDLSRVEEVADVGEDVPNNALFLQHNRTQHE